MKSSYNRVNQECDHDEIFTTYPPSLDFPVDEGASESGTTNRGMVWYGDIVGGWWVTTYRSSLAAAWVGGGPFSATCSSYFLAA
jgi:hypothetical protein